MSLRDKMNSVFNQLEASVDQIAKQMDTLQRSIHNKAGELSDSVDDFAEQREKNLQDIGDELDKEEN